MQSKLAWIAAVLSATLVSADARAETLAELVKKEEGVAFGVCALAPRLDVAGKEIHVVVPARFAEPGIWVTRSILFVGVDDGKSVQGVAEAKALDDIPPREVISVACNKNTLTIRMPVKTLSYTWNGKEFRKRTAGR
jgi:hypothetical protein